MACAPDAKCVAGRAGLSEQHGGAVADEPANTMSTTMPPASHGAARAAAAACRCIRKLTCNRFTNERLPSS